MAVDPVGTGGVSLRASHGPVRTRWLALLRGLLPEGAPWRKMPLNIADGRLLGGLDLAATLAAGRPVTERGLLAEAEGGAVLLAMAERAPAGLAGRLAAALDATPLALIALDEGAADDERTPASLLERLAFHVQLDWVGAREPEGEAPGVETIGAARARLPGVQAGDAVLAALCGTAAALGVASVRGPLLALRVACAAAALAGRDEVTEEDAALACRLVLAPRATVLPVAELPPDAQEGSPPPPDPQTDQPPDQQPDPPPPDADPGDAPQAEPSQPESSKPDDPAGQGALEDILLDAARAAIPAGLLAQLQSGAVRGPARSPAGVSGAAQAGRRGRPAGIRPGDPRGPERLNLIETLRAAAPWQRLRGGGPRLQIRRDDFRVTRTVQRAETTTIFVVDASGSSAFNRLAEAKGAVELLLADCYVRRDRVAVVAFRGKAAELLLPPTRSLVRAKRSLAGLPGGGGTPLAAGIDAGFLLADAVRRRGGTPNLVLMTDGRGNVAQDGRGGRERAQADAMQAARQVRLARVAALLVDTSPRPGPAGQRLAVEMAARYVPLPYANAAMLSEVVAMAARSGRPQAT